MYPRESHGDAIIHLVKYLKATREQGIVLYPEFRKSFEVYDDAYFCGNWYLPTSGDNLSTTNSHTVYVILYDGCPIILCSKLQTKIALSTTNAGYIALLQSLLDVIPIMQLLREMKANVFPTLFISPEATDHHSRTTPVLWSWHALQKM